jgi:hypothetical protein
MSHYFSLEKEKTMSHDVSNNHTTRFVWSAFRIGCQGNTGKIKQQKVLILSRQFQELAISRN